MTHHLSASILAADTANLAVAVQAAAAGGAASIHVDVMDGRYVDNFAFSPKTIADLRRVTDLPLHAHLEVAEPVRALPLFAAADMIIVQEDTLADLAAAQALIRRQGNQVGIAVNPDQPVERLEPYLSEIDLLLVMAVWPGFGGQPFDATVLAKVAWAAAQRQRLGLAYAIGVDGGISAATIGAAAAAGADFFAVGSAVFQGDVAANVHSLLAQVR
ncbi:MAG: ribulose-phosphate 3-epimerase [Caldilineaceae bacterium]|nr:ribulose-phosphate 3-epimerase [Caldilineaceae bacterium]